MARSPETITTQASRLLYAILGDSFQGDYFNTEDWYGIDVSRYAEVFQLSLRQAYDDIKQAALDAMKSEVRFRTVLEDGTVDVVVCHIFQAVNYNDGHGSVAVRWGEDIIKHISGTMLQGLEGKYTSRGHVAKLDENILSVNQSSVYTMKLYEFLQSWKYKKRVVVSLEELDILLNGAISKYKTYGEAKRRILEPAFSDIKLLTGLSFEAKEIKRTGGKKVIGLGFGFC